MRATGELGPPSLTPTSHLLLDASDAVFRLRSGLPFSFLFFKNTFVSSNSISGADYLKVSSKSVSGA